MKVFLLPLFFVVALHRHRVSIPVGHTLESTALLDGKTRIEVVEGDFLTGGIRQDELAAGRGQGFGQEVPRDIGRAVVIEVPRRAAVGKYARQRVLRSQTERESARHAALRAGPSRPPRARRATDDRLPRAVAGAGHQFGVSNIGEYTHHLD